MLVLSRIYQLSDRLSRRIHPTTLEVGDFYANFVKSPLYNPHLQVKLVGLENITGDANPYYFGATAADRVQTTPYKAAKYGAFENIASRTQSSSVPFTADIDETGGFMLASLLAAPYHAKALLDRRMVDTGTGFATYSPYGFDPKLARGHVLVMNGGISPSGQVNPKVRKGVLTYPCNNQEGLSQALYNESPNPFGDTRNLAVNPIGQPVYIIDSDATKIEVSNVVFTDTDRNIDVPVQILDSNNDPHKNTGSAMKPNEAFIMPLTDSFDTCRGFRKGNCGLHEFTNHSVSFDLIADGEFERRTINFKTGKFSL